jgi:hypothetical protein
VGLLPAEHDAAAQEAAAHVRQEDGRT